MSNPILGHAVVTKTVDDPRNVSGARSKAPTTVFFADDECGRLALFAFPINNLYQFFFIARTFNLSQSLQVVFRESIENTPGFATGALYEGGSGATVRFTHYVEGNIEIFDGLGSTEVFGAPVQSVWSVKRTRGAIRTVLENEGHVVLLVCCE